MPKRKTEIVQSGDSYEVILSDVVELLEQSRRLTARSVNAIMTATYWEIGRRIVEVEQKGEERAEYGEELLKRLSKDLTDKFGRGFSRQNLQQMRLFYSTWQISQTLSAKSEKCQTLSGKSGEIVQTSSAQSLNLAEIAKIFPRIAGALHAGKSAESDSGERIQDGFAGRKSSRRRDRQS